MSVGYIGEQIVIGRDRLVLSDSGVCVENGRIVLVGQQRHIREASDQIVVCDDCTIMPGLIDTHVHLALSGGVDPLGDYMRTPPDRLLLQMTRRAAALLNAGVTSARDCGGPALTLTVRDGISAGEVLGPRLLVCGQPITITGGHCHPFGMLADTAEDCRAAARQVLGQGVDFLKVMVTGGTMTHGCPAWQSQYDGPEIDAIVTEGTRWGKPTAAHCHGVQGIALAARAGVRTIEHCSWMVPSGHSYDADITAEIAACGIFVCPTPSGRFRRRLSDPIKGERFRLRAENYRRMAGAGVKLIAGTDAGVTNVGFRTVGESLQDMELFGLSRVEVIESATGVAAEALCLDQEVGTLEAGKAADLLIVRGDPLRSLAALSDVALVVAKGRVVVADRRLAPNLSSLITGPLLATSSGGL